MDPQTFHRFLAAPGTRALLDRLIADNAAVDARLVPRYVIRRHDGFYWQGGTTFVDCPQWARQFADDEDAWRTAMLELTRSHPMGTWQVVPVEES